MLNRKPGFPGKFLAILLIIAQIAMPTASYADDVVRQVVEGVVRQLLQPGVQQPAQYPQMNDPAPIARSTGGGSASGIQAMANGNAGAFDPTNALTSREQFERLNAAKAMIEGKSELTAAETANYVAAMRPYTLYLENYERIKAGGGVTVMPGQEAVVGLSTFCLDWGFGPPERHDRMQLIPSNLLIDKEARPAYDALMAYYLSHPEKHDQIQQALWDIRNNRRAMFGPKKTPDEVKELVESALPGPEGKKAVKDLDEYYRIQGQLAMAKDKALPIDRNKMLSQWKDVSSLAPGVSAVAIDSSGNAKSMVVKLTNNSNKPFVFNPTQYAGLSSNSGKQRIGIAGVENILGNNGQMLLDEQFKKSAEETIHGAAYLLMGVKAPWAAPQPFLEHPVMSGALQDTIKAVPVLGSGINAYEFATGTDYYTGQPLSPAQYALAGAGMIPGTKLMEGIFGHAVPGVIAALKRGESMKTTADITMSNTASNGMGAIEDAVFDENAVTMKMRNAMSNVAWDTLNLPKAKTLIKQYDLKAGSPST